MANTMKGFAMLGIGKVGWIEKEIPKCGPLDAIVKPLAIAICTSDVHTVYEGAITPDWNSLEAQAGYSMHSGGMLAGWKFSNFKDGVFSEYFHVNDADGNLALIPDGMTVEEACILSDMVPTGFHAVELADVQFGDTVLVIGIGAVGLMSVAGANLRGASRIICVGTRPVSVEAAKGYGATDFISYKEGPIEEQVMALTNGKGVDKVVMGVAMVLAVALSLGLFVLLPNIPTRMLTEAGWSPLAVNLISGLIRTVLLIGYIWGVGKVPDMRRTFQYHGSEHKTVYCHEANLPLTPANAQKFSTLHPRCGTSFILITFILSILLYTTIDYIVLALTGALLQSLKRKGTKG